VSLVDLELSLVQFLGKLVNEARFYLGFALL